MEHDNLPVARLVSEESILDEIETLTPINNTVIAIIATKEDIDTDPYPETVFSVNHNPSPVSQPRNINERITNSISLPIISEANINKFMDTRKQGLIAYGPVFMINLIYICINPIGVVFLGNILFNLLTLISGKIKLIKTNIITNAITNISIMVLNILFTFNINTFMFYFLEKEFKNKQSSIEVFYIIILYIVSFVVILTYLYLIYILNKLKILYGSFSQWQLNILSVKLNL